MILKKFFDFHGVSKTRLVGLNLTELIIFARGIRITAVAQNRLPHYVHISPLIILRPALQGSVAVVGQACGGLVGKDSARFSEGLNGGYDKCVNRVARRSPGIGEHRSVSSCGGQSSETGGTRIPWGGQHNGTTDRVSSGTVEHAILVAVQEVAAGEDLLVGVHLEVVVAGACCAGASNEVVIEDVVAEETTGVCNSVSCLVVVHDLQNGQGSEVVQQENAQHC